MAPSWNSLQDLATNVAAAAALFSPYFVMKSNHQPLMERFITAICSRCYRPTTFLQAIQANKVWEVILSLGLHFIIVIPGGMVTDHRVINQHI
jgi:hypothetical protein